MATLNTTANLTQITAPRVPLIDERTGLVSREWYRFFLSLYDLTGGGQNNTTLTDLQVGPPPAQQEDLTGLVINIESLKTQPNQESALEQISELEKQIQGLATAIGCACSEVAAELQKQIDALNVVPLPNISASLTSGTSVLYGNGSGGFSNVVIGSGITFSGGTLSATGTGGTVTSVSGTGAVNGITLTGTVTSSGSLTLGGALSGIANAQLTNSAVTINGVSTSLGGSVSVGTVTNVAALNLGTTGTDLNSTVATSTTTPVITLNVPTASAANRGALSAADWTTFNNKQAAGTYVNSVGGTSPVVSSGGTAPVISLAANYGDTQNPYASKASNFVLAAPNGGAGNPTFRAIVAADIPTLNQNTTGNAATVTTNANLTGAVTSVGNATSLGSFTSAQLATALTDETGSGAAVFATSPTLVTPALGTPSSGVVTNLTGTASININGTVGATTRAAGSFTTVNATGNVKIGGGASSNNQLLMVNSASGIAAGLQLFQDGVASWVIRSPASSTALVFESSNVERARLLSTGLAVIGALSCTGALSKGSGSFRVDHPLPALTATRQLVHSFIEGPKADLIYRGKVALVDGQATVNIDTAATMTEGTFEVLCRDVQCFTTNESDWTCVRGKVIGNILTIEAEDITATSVVSWMVIGERKDPHMMETEWTDENGRVIVEPLKPTFLTGN